MRGDFNQIRPIVSNHHTRKSFFAKAIAGLAGLGLFGGNRLAAKTATGTQPAQSATSAPAGARFVIQADTRSVARSVDSL